jgi:Fe-Mn family superoxide dismutase
MHRRAFLKWSLEAGAWTAMAMMGWACSRNDGASEHPIRLPPLPYAVDALAPYLSEETLRFHYDQHHRGYVRLANQLVRDAGLQNKTLVDIMRISYRPEACEQNALFNNAAQVYNHTFYWNSMKPDGGGSPKGAMEALIAKCFGSYAAFRDAFAEKALSRFASGWTWLVLAEGRLKIVNTANADTPLVRDLQPVLVIDVWEHAYYLDYRNRRDRYVEAFLDHLVNWKFAAANLGEA